MPSIRRQVKTAGRGSYRYRKTLALVAGLWALTSARQAHAQATLVTGLGGPEGFGTSCSSGPDYSGPPTTNGVWWSMSPGQLLVTWDQVGFFPCHAAPVMQGPSTYLTVALRSRRRTAEPAGPASPPAARPIVDGGAERRTRASGEASRPAWASRSQPWSCGGGASADDCRVDAGSE
jgi:hypothetical protein